MRGSGLLEVMAYQAEETTTNHQPPTTNHQPSTKNHQPKTNHQPL
jgi:hypothetical protein